MSRRGATTCLVVLATSAVVLSGCGSSTSNAVDAVDDGHGHRLLVHHGRSNASASAQVQGTLALNADSCLGLGSAADFTVILFPHGTGWSRSGTVNINGQSLHAGDSITLGGGADDSEEARAAVAKYCPTAVHDVWDTS